MTALGGFLAAAESSLTSNGLLNGNGQMILNALVESTPLRRTTEDGNPRITDTGEFRSTYGQANQTTATFSVTPTLIQFAGEMYGHRNGQYREAVPRVKRNGVWVVPKVYVKNNGTWKRVY